MDRRYGPEEFVSREWLRDHELDVKIKVAVKRHKAEAAKRKKEQEDNERRTIEEASRKAGGSGNGPGNPADS